MARRFSGRRERGSVDGTHVDGPASPPPERSVQPTRLAMTRDVYDEIARTVGSLRAEHGGALGRYENEQAVRFFRFDHTSRNTGATYSPDHKTLNAIFRTDWNPKGIRLAGFVHSHPSGFTRPSPGDLLYAERILAAIPDLPFLFLPIVQTVPDRGSFKLAPFVVFREGESVACRPVALELVDAGGEDLVENQPNPMFDRVTEAYDLDRMARSRVVAVGVGGAAAFLDDLARCGVGEFVLIDEDVITETNLATQQVYRRDLGRPKVTALAERLSDINPAVRVRAVRRSLDDIADHEMRALCLDSIDGPPPQVALLCGLTDNFYAQARINALALHLGVPSLCAQVWREGRGAEVTFTYPGLTPACHRCILSSRYAAFLSGGFVNDVTSHGTPIFATTRLNAIKGFVALTLLHHRGDDSPAQGPVRWAELAARIGPRNLLQIRMDPDLTQTLGIKTFDRVFSEADTGSLLFDETVWRPQDPQSGQDGTAPCPDCGGTGDLRDARGTFDDTRAIRTAGR
jgi:proteasome lid subunit RPN8/RPN11